LQAVVQKPTSPLHTELFLVQKEIHTMAKLGIGFGVVLILLGIWGFVAVNNTYPTVLVPFWFGLALAISGALARTADARRRKLWIHTAAGLGLLGFLSAATRAIIMLVKAHGAPDYPIVFTNQVAMAVICLVYVLLCVRSFIAVRRSRKIAA
jgi:fucose 4-O-acetylase-like acetyltransferase